MLGKNVKRGAYSLAPSRESYYTSTEWWSRTTFRSIPCRQRMSSRPYFMFNFPRDRCSIAQEAVVANKDKYTTASKDVKRSVFSLSLPGIYTYASPGRSRQQRIEVYHAGTILSNTPAIAARISARICPSCGALQTFTGCRRQKNRAGGPETTSLDARYRSIIFGLRLGTRPPFPGQEVYHTGLPPACH
jgi:hypothetical protein